MLGALVIGFNALRNMEISAALASPFRERLTTLTNTDIDPVYIGYFPQDEQRECTPWIICNEPEYLPTTSDLDAIFHQFCDNIAVFYKNLFTGYTYMHNPDRVFFGASLSKAVHAFYVYTLAERGWLDMYAIHTFTAEDHWGGTGILRFEPAGTQLTTRELLGHSIVYSCNVSFRMMIRYTANMSFSFSDFVAEIGADSTLTRDIISQNTTARDMGIWFYAIFNYFQAPNRYGQYFLHDLMNTAETSHHYFTRWEGSFGTGGDVNVRLLQSDYPLARKYGWSTNAFHDAGIIYGPSPYILVVLTTMDRGAHELFEEISCLFQSYNRQFMP